MLVGLQAAAEETLRQAKDDQLSKTVRDAAEERADREHRDADHEIAFASQDVAKPSGDRQHNSVRNEVGSQGPGCLVTAGGEAACDVGQRHVDNGGVEDLHKGRECNGYRDQPWIMAGLPSAAGRRCTGFTHWTVTEGWAEMPSGSGMSGLRPLSITILTGTRCTTLTKLPVAFSGGNAVNFEPEPS